MFTGPQGGLVIIQSTGAVTTGTHGYEEACQLFVYIPQQLHVSYILKRIEVFFLIVVVSNNDNDKKKKSNNLSSFKQNLLCYPSHGRMPVR